MEAELDTGIVKMGLAEVKGARRKGRRRVRFMVLVAVVFVFSVASFLAFPGQERLSKGDEKGRALTDKCEGRDPCSYIPLGRCRRMRKLNHGVSDACTDATVRRKGMSIRAHVSGLFIFKL